MGVSTNALLYFGFTFCDVEDSDETPWPEEVNGEEYDEEDWLTECLSEYKIPNTAWIENGENTEWNEWFKNKREFLGMIPIQIVSHCSCDYPIYAICIKESFHKAYRGTPSQLGMKIESESSWRRILMDYCERLGIEWQEPSWELASMWC